MKNLLKKFIGKNKEVRTTLVEKTIGDVDCIESATIEEFNFIKACVELSKLNEQLFEQVDKQITEMEETINRLNDEVKNLNKQLENGL